MTDYFEVHERDGAARLGELRLRDPVTTPAVADEFVVDAGSLWTADREPPDGSDAELTVLPHRAFPAGTEDVVQEAFAVDYPDVDYPSAAVVTGATAADHGCDASVLSTAAGVVGHGASFRDEMIAVREATPPDTALYLPGVATPANVATLVAAGADLVDARLARVKGREGVYCTTDGEYHLDELAELPGAFPSDSPLPEFDREDCVAHNVAALRGALATVRTRIRRGRLRDYLEGQARHENWLTAAFREFDAEYRYLERRTPVIREAELSAASEDTLRRVEIQRFAHRVTTRYRNRFSNPLVLVPCSARKPYSDSQSHAQFHRAIDYRGHVASMTSPIGVVPQELECTYPAQHYDAVVTGHWTDGEKTFVADVLERYLERNDYPRVIAHVPGEGYRGVCERVADRVDVPFEFTVEDHPTTESSLSNLSDALEGELRYSKRTRQHNTIRAIADYQFGPDAGDALFPDLRTTGRHPKLQARDDADEQLAAQVPQYGTLAFTLAGARHWAASDAPTGRVHIDGFVPHGSVLAPGVVDCEVTPAPAPDATDGIRVGDEVVVEGPAAFGVGRAAMSGPEMRDSSRGVAVEMRHVTELG
jgi:archaeosine synthase